MLPVILTSPVIQPEKKKEKRRRRSGRGGKREVREEEKRGLGKAVENGGFYFKVPITKDYTYIF